MSVAVNFKKFPPHMMESTCTKTDKQRVNRSPENVLTRLSFPKSKIALWDPTPTGDVVSLHLSYYRNPRLLVLEKALRLAHRHARQNNKPLFSCFFLGSVIVDDDEEGVTITVDRFDPGREGQGSPGKVPTALLPGDFLVPCTVSTQGPALADTIVHSAEDFHIAFKMLQHCCCSREPLESSKLLTMKVHLNCTEHMDNVRLNLHWAAVTLANTLDATPIRPVPVIPTALARNLSSPMSLAQVQNTCKYGFLTMDQTRKLLLILESDPKAYTLPLVGIWLSGITHIHSPQVWTCCLRYLFSSSLHDRVMSERGAFLVVLYSLTHREPEFYQCQLYSGQKELGFQLLTSTESINLYKNVEPSESRPLQFELSAESQNREREFFQEVASRVSFSSAGVNSPQNKLSVTDQDSGVEDEDLSPRPSPSPHPLSQQLRRIHPSVPELSLVFDGNFVEARKVGLEAPANNPPPTTAPHFAKGAFPPLPHSAHPGAKLPSQGPLAGPPAIRRPLTPAILTEKGCKGRLSPGQHLPTSRKGGPPAIKSSGSSASSTSSSSSSSTPRSGPSPNSSILQLRSQPPISTSKRGISPVARMGQPSTHRPPSPAQPPGCRGLKHSASVPHLHVQAANFHTPYPGPNPGSGCSCRPQHGSGPYYRSNSWQGQPSAVPASPGPCCPSDSTGDCSFPPFTQGVGRHSLGQCGPVYMTSSPVDQPNHGTCPPVQEPSVAALPAGQKTSPCKGHCCLAQSSYRAVPTSCPPLDNAVGLLPADAYRILVEQDRQLKLMHAQIQKLLEAQSNHQCSSKGPCTHTPPQQSETQVEVVATETQMGPGVQLRKSVSIAVSTGASLFWSPSSEQEEAQVTECQTPSVSAVSTSTEEDSVASSLRPVVAPSYSESTAHKDTLSSDAHRARPQTLFQSPVLEEGGASQHHLEITEQDSCLQINSVQDEQKFYQDLLLCSIKGQVNSRLEASVPEAEPERERQAALPDSLPPKSPPASRDTNRRKPSGSKQLPWQDDVLRATLRQLQQLGVTVDLGSLAGKATKTTVESASTLACINPEAVIPRLSYMSFSNVGASGLCPSGPDLSLEANAIALKYLSDSQLTQLSVRRGDGPLPAALLQPSHAERSMVGLSVMSPNNMSIATRKYMKRYGLIEAGDSSEEEEDKVEEEGRQAENLESTADAQIRLTASGPTGEGSGGQVLKNITNEVHPPQTLNQDSQSQLLRELRPKMKLLADQASQNREKENGIQLFPEKLHPALSEMLRPSTQESVGNFLDVSRLRQLPKLF
ncbi:STIL protein, partial [Amia calva]|nr:STIL protein [Amia calva]